MDAHRHVHQSPYSYVPSPLELHNHLNELDHVQSPSSTLSTNNSSVHHHNHPLTIQQSTLHNHLVHEPPTQFNSNPGSIQLLMVSHDPGSVCSELNETNSANSGTATSGSAGTGTTVGTDTSNGTGMTTFTYDLCSPLHIIDVHSHHEFELHHEQQQQQQAHQLEQDQPQ